MHQGKVSDNSAYARPVCKAINATARIKEQKPEESREEGIKRLKQKLAN